MAGFRFHFSELIKETEVMANIVRESSSIRIGYGFSLSFLSAPPTVLVGNPKKAFILWSFDCLRTIPSNQYDRKSR